MNKPKIRFLITAVLLVFFLTGAGMVTYSYGPTGFPPGINPLTGLPVANINLLERRPFAVKVTNFPRNVRPQWGLSLADHVYEYYIGDNMTRFIGIFYGNDADRVGPVRSARLFDEHVMRMYKAYFVFGYADVRVRDELFDDDLIPYLVFETPTNCPPICRYDNGLSYNNLFLDTAGLTKFYAERGRQNSRQPLDGLVFDFSIPAGGQAGEKFGIYFTFLSYNRWEYDLKSGRYLRYQETESDRGSGLQYAPLIDALSSQQISASNVVILRVPHEIYYQSSSTLIWDMPLGKRGTGYAFRDGKIYPLIWSHASSDQLLTLSTPAGEPYPLKPGNVWYEIIDIGSQFSFHSDGSWYFTTSIP